MTGIGRRLKAFQLSSHPHDASHLRQCLIGFQITDNALRLLQAAVFRNRVQVEHLLFRPGPGAAFLFVHASGQLHPLPLPALKAEGRRGGQLCSQKQKQNHRKAEET